MRKARCKLTGEGAYYHIVNHVGGAKNSLPFTDCDKRHGINLVEKITRYYLLEVVSLCWMGNHFHMLLHSPDCLPSLKIAARRYNKHYCLGKKSSKFLSPDKNPNKCSKVAANLIDISHFMKCLQQTYSIYYNKKYNRQGPLWKERFWSTLLEGATTLWDCVKYIELNSVRAGIERSPENYPYSTWGIYSKTGKHPFHSNFVKHMSINYFSSNKNAAGSSICDQLYSLFSLQLKSILARENRLTEKEMQAEIALAYKNNEVNFAKYLIRIREWSRGKIIGSSGFVQKIAKQFESKIRIGKSKMSHGNNYQGTKIISFHKGNLCPYT